MTVDGTKTSKYTKWILVTRYHPKYFSRTGPTKYEVQIAGFRLQYGGLVSSLLAATLYLHRCCRLRMRSSKQTLSLAHAPNRALL